jgi:diguanylate cyclase (GGDEF)-like protein
MSEQPEQQLPFGDVSSANVANPQSNRADALSFEGSAEEAQRLLELTDGFIEEDGKFTLGALLRYAEDLEQAAVTAHEREELMAAMLHQAQVDLRMDPKFNTLLNPIGLREKYDDLQRSRRPGDRVFAAYIDINSFKEINDRLGHAAADELLNGYGAFLKSATREFDDAVGRDGGDEFMLIVNLGKVSNKVVKDFFTRLSQPYEASHGAASGRFQSETLHTSFGAVEVADYVSYFDVRALADEVQCEVKRHKDQHSFGLAIRDEDVDFVNREVPNRRASDEG